MPRGENPNSLKALDENREKTQFRGENAVIQSEKGNETKKYMSSARKALKSKCDDDTLTEIATKLICRAKTGNLTAIKMIFEYTDDQGNVEQTEGGIAILPEVLPENEVPQDE